jgi:hypothetical protein
MTLHKFDALIINRNVTFDACRVVKSFIDYGIDIACVAGIGTADPGFLVRDAARDCGKNLLIIPGAVLVASKINRVLIIGAVDKVVVPNNTPLKEIIDIAHANNGIVVAMNPTSIIDEESWTLIDASIVYDNATLACSITQASFAITGDRIDKIGNSYTTLYSKNVRSYEEMQKEINNSPELFVPFVNNERLVAK